MRKSRTETALGLRGIDPETKVLLQEAARREGVTMGHLANRVLRQAAEEIINGQDGPYILADKINTIFNAVQALKQRFGELEPSFDFQVPPQGIPHGKGEIVTWISDLQNGPTRK